MSTNIFDQRKCTYGEISHNTANSQRFEKCEQAKKVEIHLKLLRNIWSEIASYGSYRKLLPFEH